MELEDLIKKRDAYAGKILKLGITIAIIFLVPALIAILLKHYFAISYVYSLTFAFIISWTGVIFLYRKINKEVKALEMQIKELREKQGQTQKDTL
jgi:predicted tellurium resistance membrane protein TerC